MLSARSMLVSNVLDLSLSYLGFLFALVVTQNQKFEFVGFGNSI